MNKILGILLLVIIVVGSASVAFAEDPDDVGVNEEPNQEVVVVESKDPVKDQGDLYNETVTKKNAYDSIKRENFQNDSAYFEALTGAWGNYADALEAYDGKTNATALKDQLKNSIDEYLRIHSNIEKLYNDTNNKKALYDEKLSNFENTDEYFDGLRNSWQEYLVALSAYSDNGLDIDAWMNILESSISNYKTSLKQIEDSYNLIFEKIGAYQFELDKIANNLDNLDLMDDSSYNALRQAWYDYVNAWTAYNSSAFKDVSAEKAKIDTSITNYVNQLKLNDLIAKIRAEAEAFKALQNQIGDLVDAGVVLDDSAFDDLRQAWYDYVDALAAYDKNVNVSAEKAKINDNIDNYLDGVKLNSLIDDLKSKANAFTVLQNQIADLVDAGVVLDASAFDDLRNAWYDYVDKLAVYDKTINVSAEKARIDASISSYFEQAKLKNLLDDLNAKVKAFNDLQNEIFDASGNFMGSDFSEFDALRSAWEAYVDAWYAYDNTVDVSAEKAKINASIDSYLGQAELNRIIADLDAKANAFKALQSKMFDASGKLIWSNSSAFGDLRNAWYAYVDAWYAYDNTVDVSAEKADFNNRIAAYDEQVRLNTLLLEIKNKAKIFTELQDQIVNSLNNDQLMDDSYFDGLRNAWKAYLDSWDAYYGNNSADKLKEFNVMIEAYQKAVKAKLNALKDGTVIGFTYGEEKFVSNGWTGLGDGQISSNKDNKPIYTDTGFGVNITTDNHGLWAIVAYGNVPIGVLNVTLNYQYGKDGKTGTYTQTFAVYLYGNGTASIPISGTEGVGPDSINKVSWGVNSFVANPDFIKFEAPFPNDSVNPLFRLLDAVSIEESSNLVFKLLKTGLFDESSNPVFKLLETGLINDSDDPVFNFLDTTLPDFNEVEFMAPSTSGPNGIVTITFEGPSSIAPNAPFYPPFIAPSTEYPEPPIVPITPQSPDEDNVTDDDESINGTSPYDDEGINGNSPYAGGDGSEGSNSADDSNNGKVVGYAKSTMKQTGLPIGLLVALLMSVLVVFRRKN